MHSLKYAREDRMNLEDLWKNSEMFLADVDEVEPISYCSNEELRFVISNCNFSVIDHRNLRILSKDWRVFMDLHFLQLIVNIHKQFTIYDLLQLKENAKLPFIISGIRVQRAINDKELQILPPNLKILKLSKCNNLSNASMEKLPSQLENLRISRCRGIHSSSIEFFPSSLKKFGVVAMKLTNDHLLKLPKNLETLELENEYHLSNDCIHNLPRNLKKLVLKGCGMIDGSALLNMPTSLQYLKLVHCHQIDRMDISHLPNLQYLEVKQDPDEVIATIEGFSASLQKVYVVGCDVHFPKDFPAFLKCSRFFGCRLFINVASLKECNKFIGKLESGNQIVFIEQSKKL